MRLYEIASEYRDLVDFLDSEEFDESVKADTLIAVKTTLNDKLVACHGVLTSIKGDEATIESEISRLKSLLDAKRKRSEWLKDYIRECIILSGEKKVDTGLAVFSIRAPSKSVNIVDESVIPDEYKRVSYSVDKSTALADLKSGKQIAGLELKEGIPALIIK